jgi:hypothetical protein
VLYVIILLAYGCPLQAIVKALDLDERTVRDWHQRAANIVRMSMSNIGWRWRWQSQPAYG